MQTMVEEARQIALTELERNPNVKTDKLSARKPLRVGTDPNGHTGVVFQCESGTMGVEVNFTPDGELFLANYCPVGFATNVYR